MPIIEPAYRPPSEAYSFLLQITSGCSSNDCTFCSLYKGKNFFTKPIKEIYSDIEIGAKFYPETKRVFLMDGDALVLANHKLIPILQKLNEVFPKLERISSYANGFNINSKTDQELIELKNLKLTMAYIGLESGSQQVLDFCKKKTTVQEMIKAIQQLSKSKIQTSVMVILGLGGKNFWDMHIKETIEAINLMQPDYLSFLTLMLMPKTKLYEQAQTGEFQSLRGLDFLQEAYEIIRGLKLENTVFRSNHASNYLNLQGNLSVDKEILLRQIENVLEKKSEIKAEYYRGL